MKSERKNWVKKCTFGLFLGDFIDDIVDFRRRHLKKCKLNRENLKESG